ncbi:DSS1/SEM1 family-domain-containing protein [Lipomyces oligophaga]|uniref:DSS1/SEM1 family-domain-containing protein n=1 Tax=Lipomyces oligophaga TaxID=45792 RepID=UPI0034CE424F
MSTTDKKIETAQPAKQEEKPAVVTLEEDDEFEDFPAEDWQDEDTDLAIPGGKDQLWEENWDDDDADDDFSAQLKEELRKVNEK